MEFVTGIRTSFISVLLFFLFSSIRLRFCLAADTISPGQSLSGRQTLISEDERFELGFFAPGSSQNQYLGIWFKKVSVPTIVWVANREKPLTDTSGVLKLSNGGNLVIQNGNESIFWSISSSVSANLSTVKLLDTGNLVLIEDDSGRVLWQSFDYPSDTYIPGMKLGINLRTGHYWSLRSWKGSDDPSLGSFTLELNLSGWPEFVFYNESNPYWRFGPWNGQRWSGVPEMTLSYIYNYSYTSNKDEIAYTDSLYNSSVPFRMFLDESGHVQRSTWHEGSRRWITFWSAPKDECESYGICGVFSRCNSNYPNLCKCLPGFEPKFNEDWYLRDWTGGCVRRTALNCGEDGFFRLEKMNLPVTSLAQVDESLNIEDCKAKCLKHCSCTAYANSNVNGRGSGCVIWIGELFDLREFSDTGQEIYLRVASSELDDSSSAKKRKILAITLATTFSGVLLLLSCGFYFFKKRKITNVRSFSHVNKPRDDESGKESLEHLLFDFGTIEAATSNFAHKIGEGGFGVVYQGMLHNGQEIAVKRLSKSSEQGNDEFENEVMLVAKLQHWNLVRLLGYCTHGGEKLLIYEYMPNKSLDLFLFDRAKSAFLDWRKRFDIIIGIARGILYLHEDSRLRVIHRDLKSSNILLDADMIPKISDFGIARSFGRNQTQANTRKVVGTYGYMSPEYAMDGRFSVKSDVYSFGVLVLEILSGRKSNGSFHCDGSFSLIGHAWKLWEEGRVLEFMDPSISDSFEASEVLRCIQIGLLCVQESPNNRPDMSSIIFMLGSEATTLPTPKKPPFSTLNEKDQTDSSQTNPYSTNNMTITMVEAR